MQVAQQAAAVKILRQGGNAHEVDHAVNRVVRGEREQYVPAAVAWRTHGAVSIGLAVQRLHGFVPGGWAPGGRVITAPSR